MNKGDLITILHYSANGVGHISKDRVFMAWINEDTIAYSYDITCKPESWYETDYKSIIELNGKVL
jgi:hypothetical protein